MKQMHRTIIAILLMVLLLFGFSACSAVQNASEDEQTTFQNYLPYFEVLNGVVLPYSEKVGIEDDSIGNYFAVERKEGIINYFDSAQLAQIQVDLTDGEKQALEQLIGFGLIEIRVNTGRILYSMNGTYYIYTFDGSVPKYGDIVDDKLSKSDVYHLSGNWYYCLNNTVRPWLSSRDVLLLNLMSNPKLMILFIVLTVVIITFLIIWARKQRRKKIK